MNRESLDMLGTLVSVALGVRFVKRSTHTPLRFITVYKVVWLAASQTGLFESV